MSVTSEQWLARFNEQFSAVRRTNEDIWRVEWQIKCDGKTVLGRIFKKMQVRCSLGTFKKDIMLWIVQKRHENWIAAKNAIDDLLK